MYAYPCSRECGDVELSFAADVKQSTLIANSNGESCKYKRCCVKQDVAEVVKACEPTDEDDAIEFQWILSTEIEDKPTQKKESSQREQRGYTINEQAFDLRNAVPEQREGRFSDIQDALDFPTKI